MTNFHPHISFVSPIYLAEDTVDELVNAIEKVMITIGESYEIILVDDRSPDLSWHKMLKLRKEKEHLKCIRLSRNFGQHSAIFAGLSKAKGDWVVVLDCDLQDQPKEVIALYNKVNEGYDAALAQRAHRKDGIYKKNVFIFICQSV